MWKSFEQTPRQFFINLPHVQNSDRSHEQTQKSTQEGYVKKF